MTGARHGRLEKVDENASATTLELFFDLVFVFALTQVTAMMADDLTARGLLRGALVLAVVWWCWIGYSWLSNVVRADAGSAQVAMFVAMAAMFLIALVIPEAFDDFDGGLSGPVVFAIGYLVVRVVHLALFLIVSGNDPVLRRQLLRFTPSMIGGTALLLVAAYTDGVTQTALWTAAVAADYLGTLVIGSRGWRVNSARHFAERYGLIIIVALGESIVAIGVGVTHLPISWPIVVAATLGLSVAASMWFAYFDTSALLAERAFSRARGDHRVAMARAAFTYLHLPMIIGIIFGALGLKKVLEYVGDTRHHTLADHLYGPPLWALYGGVALYLLGQVAFAYRTYASFKRYRLMLALALLVVTPLVAMLPALATLAILAGALLLLNVAETRVFADTRREIRHAHHDHAE